MTSRTVFVGGASGGVGRRVVARLVDAGHRIIALSRSDRDDRNLRALGAEPRRGDLLDGSSLTPAVEGSDSVINVATRIPPFTKASRASAWETNQRLHRDGVENLVAAAEQVDCKVVVQASLAFVYPDHGDELIDVDTRLDPPPFLDAIVDAEAAAKEFSSDERQGVVLRFGQFFGPGAASTRAELRAARFGLSARFGPAGAWWPNIHLDDAATATVAALEVPAGTYHAVAEAATRHETTAAIATAAGRSRLFGAPGWLERRLVPSYLRRSNRVNASDLSTASGWEPTHPTITDIVDATVRETK